MRTPTKRRKFNDSDEVKRAVKPKRVYKKGKVTCKDCGRVCASQSALLIHTRVHSGEKPYQCPSCDKKYANKGGLKGHIERKHNEKTRERKFMCENCGKAFYTKLDVTVHMRTHTKETPYACTTCPSKFTQSSALLRHLATHSTKKCHGCPTCGKTFGTKENLKCHIETHTDEKKYSCSQCTSLFKFKNSLRKHLRVHAEPNHFACDHCGRTFNFKGNLKLHIESQHSETSGWCRVCSKNVPNLEMHMWRHTGEQPLKCKQCTSSFNNSIGLSAHISFKHKNVNRYKCQIDGCGMGFPRRQMLANHIDKRHDTYDDTDDDTCDDTCDDTEIQFPCWPCSLGFSRERDLARHIKHKNANKYKCQIEGCGMGFLSQQMLANHIDKHHNTYDDTDDDTCDDTEIPFPCWPCSMGFSRQSDLARHIATHKERLT